MFGLFKSKSPIEKLMAQHKKLQEEAYRLSRTDRRASDLKYAEADEIMKEIEKLKQES